MDELLTDPTEPELNARARRVVASKAENAQDARLLLQALGLIPDNHQPTNK